MEKEKLIHSLRNIGAYVTDGHFVYSTGNHGSIYIDKNKIYPHPVITDNLCGILGSKVVNVDMDLIIGPATGGIILSQGVARHITQSSKKEVLSLYVDKDNSGEKSFIIKRGYDTLIKNRRVLVVDDGLLTGATLKKIITLIRFHGGVVVGAGVIFNKRRFIADEFDIPFISSVFEHNFDETTWSAGSCPLCLSGVPIDMELGQGKNMLKK